MKTIKKIASIVKNYNGVDYYICTLIQEERENDFSYTFIPNYRIINLIPKEEFEGIQSINLDTREKEYYFDYIPTFIYERVPPRNRININEILKEFNLDYYDPLEFLLRSKTKYIGDSLLVKNYYEPKLINYYTLMSNVTGISCKNIISSIARNDVIVLDNNPIDNELLFKTINPLFLEYLKKKRDDQLKGKNVRVTNKSYKGRKNIELIPSEFNQIVTIYKNKEITADKAAFLLNISKSTFFRKLKKCQK